MRRKLIALAVVVLAAGLVADEPRPASPSDALGTRVERVVLTGIVVALAPVGALAGCGGGTTGPSPTSATAFAR